MFFVLNFCHCCFSANEIKVCEHSFKITKPNSNEKQSKKSEKGKTKIRENKRKKNNNLQRKDKRYQKKRY